MKNKELLKPLLLYTSVWRCGNDSRNPECRMGEGSTIMLNKEGYMCCLGQFSPQLNGKISDYDLFYSLTPSTAASCAGENIPDLVGPVEHYYPNTKLSKTAMSINDDPTTTVPQKIKALKKLFASYGYEIIVLD